MILFLKVLGGRVKNNIYFLEEGAYAKCSTLLDYKSNHTESGVNRRDCSKAESGKTGISKPGTWASDGLEGNFSIQHGSLLLYGFV